MKQEFFMIRTQKDIDTFTSLLEERLETQNFLEVAISIEARSRSMKQHRLMFLWNTEIANHLGLYKDEVHEMMKRRFAVPIFTRDDPDFAEMVAAVKAVRKQGMEVYAEALAREISRLTSTTDFTVEQASEYLNDMEHFAAEKGVRLTFPEDLCGAR